MLEKYPKDLKLVFKNFPLPMHPFARKAATASQAAHRQGKFREFSRKLFELSGSLSDDTIRNIAKDLKLNLDSFDRDLNDPSIQSLIFRDMNEGNQAEVRGTPTVFMNGKLVKLQNIQELGQMIETEAANKKKK